MVGLDLPFSQCRKSNIVSMTSSERMAVMIYVSQWDDNDLAHIPKSCF